MHLRRRSPRSRRERAVTLVEYCLLTALISVVSIYALKVLNSVLVGSFGKVFVALSADPNATTVPPLTVPPTTTPPVTNPPSTQQPTTAPPTTAPPTTTTAPPTTAPTTTAPTPTTTCRWIGWFYYCG